MSKLVIIGIDGLDPVLIHKWRESLPNFSEMFENHTEINLESTTPPDSICAWTSIFTGENPAEHGLIESIDYLSSKKTEARIDRSANFRGKTFWDMASKNGKSVCIINPFLAYPSWDVNGVMVSGPVFEGGSTSTFPESIINDYKIPSLGGIVDFPEKRELDSFLNRTTRNTEQLADVSLQLYKDRSPDLLFLTFLTMDRVQHFLWRFTDEEDVYYPGNNFLKGSIKDFYRVFDKIIGDFRCVLDNDTTLLVISDHGHGRRCSKSLNLNEILRRKGYLATSGKGAKGVLNMIIEKTKVFTLAAMSKYDLQDWIYKIARFVPNRKALKKSTYLIDNDSSCVQLSALCGANPYGGIDIKGITEEEYEKLRNKIIRELMDLNGTLGINIVKWVKRREQIYTGKNEKKLPDVMFELDEEYGVGMDLYTRPITANYTHKKVSGGHRLNGVLLVHSDSEDVKNMKRPASVIGMKDYILKILDA